MLILLLFALFLVGIFLGFPVVFSLGLAALLGLIIMDLPMLAMPLRMFSGIDNYPLLAIPFFILAGTIMNATGITSRLMDLAESLVGFLRSSLGQINILTSIFFAGISGSDIADAAGIGSLLIPAMKKRGYTSEEAAVITGTSSAIGPIIPPSVTMIIYGALTGGSILGLFLAGVIPGLILGGALMIVTHFLSLKRPNSMGNTGAEKVRFSLKRLKLSVKENIFTVPIPIIIVGGIYSGFFTVTEAGVSAVLYSLIVATFVYKQLTFGRFKEIFTESAITGALVGVIISVAILFSYLLSIQGFASWFMSTTRPLQTNPLLFLFVVVGLFFVMGCFIPITVILIIFAPFLPTIGRVTGLHPLHFGLIILLTLELGVVTPPYGTILFIVCHLGKTSVVKSIPTLIPYLVAMVVVVLLVIFIPSLTTLIPTALGF